jgi:glycosyltransferase involved in cell wall biosynthesis
MNDSPQVSIAISNYNYARFLGEAIDSALAQSYPNTEVIVVDDGSTDNSSAVIGRYGDRIGAVMKGNGGMASAHNSGFQASQGSILVFLDADDTLAPAAAASAVECFLDPSVVRVQWKMWEINAAGDRTGQQVPTRKLQIGNLRDRLLKEGPDACIGSPTSGNAWSREFLKQVLPIPEVLFRQHSDTYLMTLAPLYGTIQSLPEPQGFYRLHGANDYAGKPVDEKNRRNLEMYDLRCQILADRLRQMDIDANPADWKQGPGYEWMNRRHIATESLKSIVPRGAKYILVDDQQWSEEGRSTEVVSGLGTIPFLERDGRYWGRPADDATAIRELERLKREGATCIAFAWPSFWWLQLYTGFHRHLRERFACVLEDENLVIFNLRQER